MNGLRLTSILIIVLFSFNMQAQIDSCCQKLTILATYMKQIQEDTKLMLETDSILRVEVVLLEKIVLNQDEKMKILDRKFDLKTEQVGIYKTLYEGELLTNEQLEKELARKKKWYNKPSTWFGIGLGGGLLTAILLKR